MQHGNAKTGMSKQKAAKRNRKRRNALRAAGLVPMQVWVRSEDRAVVRSFVAGLIGADDSSGEE